MVHGDVFGRTEALDIGQGKLDRVFDQASHLQAEIFETILGHAFPIVPDRHFAIRPEIRRDLVRIVPLLRRQTV